MKRALIKNYFFIKKKRGRGINQPYSTKMKMTGFKLGHDVNW